MKFLITCVLIAAVLFNQAESQPFGFGGRFGRFGLGRFGLGFGGGLGMGGLGFGGLGMGLGLGVPLTIPVPVPVPVPAGAGIGMPFGGVGLGGVSPFMGKRSVNDTDAANGTVCSLTTERSVLSCTGTNFNFECGVVANLTALGSFEHRGENFRMLPEGQVSFNGSSVDGVNRVEIASWKEASEFNDFTFVHGGQKVVLSLYWSEGVQDLGFRFAEKQCWRTYVDMLRVSGPVNVRLSLNVTHL
jgi:hypothetical protein